MAGSTINTTIKLGVTLGGAGYSSPLTITGDGEIAAAAYSALALYANVTAGSIQNQGVVLGGGGSVGSTGHYGGPTGYTVGAGGDGGGGVDLLAGSLTNEGTIGGGGGGQGGGDTSTIAIILRAGGDGGSGGDGVDVGSLNSATNVINSGTIEGGSGGGGGSGNSSTLHGSGPSGNGGQGGIGIAFAAGGTLTDSGSIAGGAGGGGAVSGATGDAVSFGTGVSRLILEPGASFTGVVAANTAYANVMELASASTAGTLSGLIGSQYLGFSSFLVDPEASWTLAAGQAIAAGSALLDGGVLTGDQTTIAGGIGDTGITLSGGIMTASTNGTVLGGIGGGGTIYAADIFNPIFNGGTGGAAVYVASGSLINHGSIAGGGGGAGYSGQHFELVVPSGPEYLGVVSGNGGAGGSGVSLAGGSGYTDGTIMGGQGGLPGARILGGGDRGYYDGAVGAGGLGVSMTGGTLTNAAAGSISGGAGIKGEGTTVAAGGGGGGANLTAGSLVNLGSLTGGQGGLGSLITGTDSEGSFFIAGGRPGAGGAGVTLAGGSLTNANAVLGGAGGSGYRAVNGAGGGTAVYWSAGFLTNTTTGTIAGGTAGGGAGTGGTGGEGVDVLSVETLSNAGLITGGSAVYNYNIPVSTGGDGGVGIYFRTDGGLTNSGTVAGGSGGAGGPKLAVSNYGAIGTGNGGAGATAIEFGGVTATLVNQNLIKGGDGGAGGATMASGGTGGTGVNIILTGSATNSAGATIMGGNGGAAATDDLGGRGGGGFYGERTSLTNGGTILGGNGAPGGGFGQDGGGGGAGVRLTGNSGALNNSGLIAGGNGDGAVTYGGLGGFGVLVQVYGGVTVTNTGTIEGGSGGLTGGTGLTFNKTGTLIDSGIIAGGTETGNGLRADAVQFRQGSDQVVLRPGASITGLVDGSAGSTIELAAGTATGVLANFNSGFTGFSTVQVDSGATWEIAGGATLGSGIALTNNGTIAEATGDALTIDGAVTGTGVISLDPTAVTIGGSISAGQTVDLTGSGDVLNLSDSQSFSANITGFTAGDTIDIQNVGIPDRFEINGDEVSVVSSVLVDGIPTPIVTVFNSLTGPGGAALNPGQITLTSDGDNGTDVTLLCFCAGTQIATPHGKVAVDHLAIGDLVVTARGATRPVQWIGQGRVLATRYRRGPATPVIVRRGALGDNVPHRDLRITKGHSLYIDGVLIPVEFLVNHRSILWDDHAREVTVYHIELETHDVLVANGAPAESYRDDGNRWLFNNASERWDLPPTQPCAPVLTGGPVVDAVWRRLLDRCGPRMIVPLTDDADLHVLADGRRVDAVERGDGAFVFRLPSATLDLRIASRSAVPTELGLARDPRPLGVAVRRLVLRDEHRSLAIEADSDLLSQGFHDFEPDNGFRWTDGEARVPTALFDGMTDSVEFAVYVGMTTRYREAASIRRAA